MFKAFCENGLIETLQTIDEFKKLKTQKTKKAQEFKVNLFFSKPSIDDYKEAHQSYLSDRVFVSNDLNIPLTIKNQIPSDEVLGISNDLSGFESKKPFKSHLTSPFELNRRITNKEAKIIWQFFQLNKRDVFPNPLPIFIDKKELNGKVVASLKEETKIRFSEIIKRVFDDPEHQKDLGNYYLLFFQKKELVDLDFVPSFKYALEEMKIEEVFPLGGKMIKRINNVFEFETGVANRIFNNQLITETKAGALWLKYFGEIEYNPKYLTNNTYNQILKYRKAFYDYIYKSRRESIQNFMFQDIMLKGLLDDIRTDEYTDRNHTKEYSIKEKLNIWFSLYTYFDNTKSKIDMINKTKILFDKIKQIAENDDRWLANDEEFAFASGQLIRYLLGQSEASDRSHALLEPFLQKTDPNLYKLAIARVFETYKHAIRFYKGNGRYSFDRIMSQVMGFEPDTRNMKDLLPIVLAGYFSETIFK